MSQDPNQTQMGGGKRQGNWWAANKTSEDIQQVIKARMNEPGLSRRQLAEELGISISTLYRHIRLFGGDIDHSKSRKQDGIEDMIRRYWPHYTAREIVDMQPEGYKISKSRVIMWAQRLGVKHTAETEARIKDKTRDIVNRRDADSIRRGAEKRSRTLRMEYFRQSCGMKQQTRLRLKTMPTRHRQAAWNLETKYGYILTTDKSLIWCDENTRRTTMEHLYVKRYGFRFEPLPEGE